MRWKRCALFARGPEGVLEALAAGLVAGSSLLFGGLVALLHSPREHTLALIMAFGAGVLLSAVAYDLVLEAREISGGAGIPLGISAGALTFFAGDRMIERSGGGERKGLRKPEGVGSPKAEVLGILLDGIPESIVLGLTLLAGEGVSVALIAAIFLSNVPEAMAATSGLAASGVPSGKVMALWALITAVSGIAALAGYGILGSASPPVVAFILAFAAGAVVTMLADTMMPEAFEHGGRVAGLATTLGFAVAFTIAYLEDAGA
jgi:ZIP family zinc transporter